MKIAVKVKTNARTGTVTELGPGNYLVSVREPAREGRANMAARRLLAEYFRVPKAGIVIIVGEKSRQKIIEIIGVKNNNHEYGSSTPQHKKRT